MTPKKQFAIFVCVVLAFIVLLGAATLINLTTQVSGILPSANGGRGDGTNGTNGQVLIGNGAGVFAPGDPIVSYNYANLINAQTATAQVTGSAVRLSTFSGFGTLYVTFASITGTYTSCTLQLKNYDSLGNSLNNGSTISVTPANGTTSLNVASASGLFTAAQMSATFNCSAFGSAGTISVDYVAGISVGLMNALPTGTNSIGTVGLNAGTQIVGKFDTDQTTHGTTDLVAADLTKIAGNAVASDGNGRQILKGNYPDTTTTSYTASSKFAASSTTDNAVLPGNATNTVLVTEVRLTCTQTTAGILNVEVLKRSAADTSGTSSNMTVVPDDANYAAGVSVPKSYTGTGPTVGTPVGDVDNAQVGCMAAATAAPNDIYILRPSKPIVLRGTAQQLALNLGGAVTGGTITVTFKWMETTTP